MGVTGTNGTNGSTGATGTAGVDIYARYQDLGSALFAGTYGATIDALSATVATGALSDGQLGCAVLFTPSTSYTMLGVKWVQGSQGSYTSDNYNGVLLGTLSAGTVTWVDSTANDGNIWKGANNTWQSKAFTSSYAVTANTTYVIGFIYNSSAQVTLPTMYGLPAQATFNPGLSDFANSLSLFATKGSVSNITLNSTQAYSALTRTSAQLPMFFAYK